VSVHQLVPSFYPKRLHARLGQAYRLLHEQMCLRLQLTLSFRWLCGAVTLFSSGCSGDGGAPDVGVHQQPIFNGTTVVSGAWSGVVWLNDLCTGVLVGPSALLTAAHCGITPNTRVERGGGIELRISHCYPHPEAAFGAGNDLALCRLSNVVDEGQFFRPLLQSDDMPSGTSLATVVGFGISAPDELDFGTKRSVEIPIVDWGEEIELGSSQVGTCSGDSGAPAFINVGDEGAAADWRLFGILSSGYVGKCGVGFYSDVQRHWATLTAGLEDMDLAQRESHTESATCQLSSRRKQPSSFWWIAALVFMYRRV